MFIRTRIPHGTVSLDEQRTCSPVRIKAKPVLLPQEIIERKSACKLLVLRGRVEDLVGDALGGCSRHRRGGLYKLWEVVIIESRVCGEDRVTMVR